MEYMMYILIGLGYLKIYRAHSDAYLVGLLWPVILGGTSVYYNAQGVNHAQTYNLAVDLPPPLLTARDTLSSVIRLRILHQYEAHHRSTAL